MSAPRTPGLVSIVTPCLNSARFIRRTIESVAEQDYARIEHIVMDAEGNITEWNKQAEETFGWTRSEALGRRISAP